MVGAEWKDFLKIEDSISLEMTISDVERSISSLIGPCVRFLMP